MPSWKAISVCILLGNFALSAYFAVCTVVDILGEENAANYTTQLQPEQVFLTAKDELYKYEEMLRNDSARTYVEPIPGYGMYWSLMREIGEWYTTGTFQIFKVGLLTCSLLVAVTSLLALISITIHREWCGCWCCHPTPLIFVEGGLSLVEVLIIGMALFCIVENALMSVTNVVALFCIFFAVFFQSFVISKYYRSERERLDEVLYEEIDDVYCKTEEEDGDDVSTAPSEVYCTNLPPDQIQQVLEMFPGLDETVVLAVIQETGSREEAVEALLIISPQPQEEQQQQQQPLYYLEPYQHYQHHQQHNHQ